MALGLEAKNNESYNIWIKLLVRKERESYQARGHSSIATTAPARVLQVLTHGKSPHFLWAICKMKEKKTVTAFRGYFSLFYRIHNVLGKMNSS